MEAYRILGITPEDYNTALFEAGCLAAETSYASSEALKLKRRAGYWRWLREQRMIVDACCLKKIEKRELTPGTQNLFRSYYEMLCEHLKNVYLPERLENELLEKEVCRG